MPNYNGEHYIAEAIRSVQAQTFTYWELLVIDDCSTDGSTLSINQFLVDARIKLFINAQNQGVANARNIGIEHAKGQYISFLDSDDLWAPEKLKKQYDLLNGSDYFCSHTEFIEICEEGEYVRTRRSPRIVNRSNLLLHNYIGNLSGMYDAFSLGKRYQKDIMHEDYDMWLDILISTDSVKPTGNLASYRVRSKSLSSNKIKSLIGHYGVLRRNQTGASLSVLFTCFHIMIKFIQKVKK